MKDFVARVDLAGRAQEDEGNGTAAMDSTGMESSPAGVYYQRRKTV
ncbi:MAG: hypothetical protein LBT46_13010 [Planctomycetaceae bacterium]|nr:hypothetical protein [Planctomycetaceae bacterium]